VIDYLTLANSQFFIKKLTEYHTFNNESIQFSWIATHEAQKPNGQKSPSPDAYA
jgi:hypothetical protein